MIRRCAALLVPLALLCFSLAAQEPAGQNAGERRRAARSLARQGADAIPKLAPLLADPDLEVRIEAVKALVEIGTQNSLDPLITAARDNDPEIQIRATDGLVNFYVPGYVRTGLSSTLHRAGNTIKARFTDINDQVIDLYVGVRPEVIQALGRLIRGGVSMESRANAARAVGVLRGAAAIPELLAAVRSKDSQLMYESLIALRKINVRSAGTEITSTVRDPDSRVQVAAIETAGLLVNKEALPDLREVLKTTRDKAVRRAALTAIARLPDAANRGPLSVYLSDKDPQLRGAAAEGLGRLKDAADLPALEKAFDDEKDGSARVSLAFALVMLGKLEVSEFSPFQYLVNTLNSSSHSGEAQPLLIEAAREPAVLTALHPALRSGTRDEKKGLAWVMAQSGGRDEVPLLEALTHDTDVTVASEALRALRTLKLRLEQ
jgi:HEAT repeat protein